MNVGVGGKIDSAGAGTYTADDPANPRNYILDTTSQRTSILNRPGPGRVWVFLDEHPDSINDGTFQYVPGFTPTSYAWQDLPASLHDGGCSISFADGHSMIKKWSDSRTTMPVRLLFYALKAEAEAAGRHSYFQRAITWMAVRKALSC